VRRQWPATRQPQPPSSAVEAAPADFLHKEFRSRDLLDHRLTIQVAPDDCTGCGVCVDVCPFDCIYPSPANAGPEYLGKVAVNEKTCVGCKLCEEVCGWEGIYIMPGKEKEAFLSSLGYDAPPDGDDAS
jgi:NAD-dependent dihydropyrimidine dehydrogenase PreA subunit